MKSTCDYLDALRARFCISSDYALAKFLDITRATVSGYRHGKSTFSDDIAFKVADCLEIPREVVYLDIQAERAAKSGNQPVFAALSNALRRLGGAAAGFIIFLSAFSAPTDANASFSQNSDFDSSGLVRPLFDNNIHSATQIIGQRLRGLISRAAIKLATIARLYLSSSGLYPSINCSFPRFCL